MSFTSKLEHANITVSDPQATADMLSRIFGWETRWSGESIHGGTSVHVGEADTYLAIYSRGATTPAGDSYNAVGGLNHIGIVVDDLDAAERRVEAAGFKPDSHADYEPGRRFYFYDHDGIEFEVISYERTA